MALEAVGESLRQLYKAEGIQVEITPDALDFTDVRVTLPRRDLPEECLRCPGCSLAGEVRYSTFSTPMSGINISLENTRRIVVPGCPLTKADVHPVDGELVEKCLDNTSPLDGDNWEGRVMGGTLDFLSKKISISRAEGTTRSATLSAIEVSLK